MSSEIEQTENNSNEQLTKQLEEKYNINLDLQTEIGEKTYWDLRKYFTKEIETDNLLISTDATLMCCCRTDIESIKEEFNKQLNELIKYESNQVCEDPYAELLEDAIGHPCPYAINSNLENNNLITDDTPPPYNLK